MKLLNIRSINVKLAILSLMHFATDGACAYIVFTKLYPENPGLAAITFVAYNLLAFVTQSPVGLLIDKYPKPKLMLGVSTLLLSLGYLCSDVCILAVFFIGMANSLFHVAGGKYVTSKSGNDISHLGIFVSTGAVGLALGQRYAGALALIIVFFGITILGTAVMVLSKEEEDKEYPEEFKAQNNAKKLALLAVAGVVLARSFVGKIMSYSFTAGEYTFLAIALATALGKAMGGIFSKLVGIKWTSIVSMSIAAMCLTLGTGSQIAFVLGVFAFNFTMPLTLYFANILLKGKEGFAFGTLAAFLVPGYFFAMPFKYSIAFKVLTALICLLSCAVIIYTLRRIRKDDASPDTNCDP